MDYIDLKFANLTKWERAYLKGITIIAINILGLFVGYFIYYFIAVNFILPGIDDYVIIYFIFFWIIGNIIVGKFGKFFSKIENQHNYKKK